MQCEIAARVQKSLEEIGAQAALRETRSRELLRDGASLRASTSSMRALLDECESQIADLVGKRDPDGAVSGCVPPRSPATPHRNSVASG